MSRAKNRAQNRAEIREKARAQSRQKPNPWAWLTGWKLYAVFSALLAVVTIALYSPVIGHSFVAVDDREYVTANPHIHDGLSWATVKWSFTSLTAANWHPLTWLSHALDYQLFGLNPAGHHFDAVLLHALNAVVLFLLLAWVTKRIGPSMLVAALFAVHPLNVESVAWVSERKNVLSTLFFLLTIAAYMRYARKPGWQRYLLVMALFAAGLAAKPMVVTLPFLLLLLDYWPLERLDMPGYGVDESRLHTFLKLVLEKVPLLILSAASAWITMKAQLGARHTFQEFPFSIRLENAVVAYGLYLWKMLWPAHLAFYPYSEVGLPAWQWILSALVLIGVTTFVVAFRQERYLPVGWFWFLGTLVPVIGLVQVGDASMADRYAYITLIGIFIMMAWGLDDYAEAKNVAMVLRVIPAACVIAALCWLTSEQIGYWESDYDLWSHTLTVAESPLAHNALGVALMEPDSQMTRDDLRNFGSGQERLDEARRHFERALELHRPEMEQDPRALSDMARTLNNLGNVDRLQNRIDEGRRHGEAALQIYRRLAQQNPERYLADLASTLSNLGGLDRLQNRSDEARQRYEEALTIQRQLAEKNPSKYLPNIAMTLNEFGLLESTQNRMDESRRDYEEALNIERQLVEQSPAVYLPNLAMTLNEFGILDATENRMDDARAHYEEGLTIERQLAEQNPAVYLPDVAMALTNLARVDRLEKRTDEARVHYQEALSLLRRLSQHDGRYRGEIAGVEASLQELEKPSGVR